MVYKIKGMYGRKKFISPKTFKTKKNAQFAMNTVKRLAKTARKNAGHYKSYHSMRIVKVRK